MAYRKETSFKLGAIISHLDLISFSINFLFLLSVFSLRSAHAVQKQINRECKDLGAHQGITKIPVVGSCRRFAYCIGPVAELAICPPEFLFSVEKQDCEIAENVKCQESTANRQEVDPDCGQKCEVIPDKGDCSSYKLCDEGRSEMKACHADQRFDKKKQRCAPQLEAECFGRADSIRNVSLSVSPLSESKRMEEKLDGLCSSFWKNSVIKIPHPNACHKFIYCAHGKAHVASCPGGLVFNTKLGDCDFLSVGNMGNCSINFAKDECISRPCGIYPTQDCNAFVICNDGGHKKKKCQEGFKFDIDSGECLISSQAHCWAPPENIPLNTGRMGRLFAKADDEEIQPYMPRTGIKLKVCRYHGKVATEPIEYAAHSSVIVSPNVTNFGEYSSWKECPDGMYAKGLQNFRRVVIVVSDQKNTEPTGTDHAGVTSMALVCMTPEELVNDKKKIISVVPRNLPERPWKKVPFFNCETGTTIGFRLNQVPLQKNGDNIGTDMIKMICSCGPPAVKPYQHTEYKEFSGVRGVWTESKTCQARQAICGFSAQTHDWIESPDYDNTGINNIKMRCCDVASPGSKYPPAEEFELITTLDNINSIEDKYFDVEVHVGLSYHNLEKWEKAIQFFESIGYNIKSLKRTLRKLFHTQIPCKKQCMYFWADLADDKRIWDAVVIEHRKLLIPKHHKMAIYQIVGRAGPYQIKTEGLLQDIVETAVNSKILKNSELEFIPVKQQHVNESVIITGKIGEILNPMDEPFVTSVACPYMEQTDITKPLRKEANGVVIGSKRITNWGKWSPMKECPKGMYVAGLSGYRSMLNGPDGKVDQGGLTSFALMCRSTSDIHENHFLTFTAPGIKEPDWNDTIFYTCDEGGAIGFKMNVMPEKAGADNLATDNVRLHCSCGPSQMNPFNDPLLKSMSGMRGNWGGNEYCDRRQVICGLEAQMHDYVNVYEPSHDNTGLNNIRVKCCNMPSPVIDFKLEERRLLLVTINDMENPSPAKEKEAFLILPIGIEAEASDKSEELANFYDSFDYGFETISGEMERCVGDAAKRDCPTCEYKWTAPDPTIFLSMFNHKEPVLVPFAKQVQFYQIVATYGFYLIRTNQYVLVTTTKKGKNNEQSFVVQPKKPIGKAKPVIRLTDDDDPLISSGNFEVGSSLISDITISSTSVGAVRDPTKKPLPVSKEVNRFDFDLEPSDCKFHGITPSEKFEKALDGSGIIIQSPEVTNWGNWSEWQYCPKGTYVTGITGYREVVETLNDVSDRLGILAVGFICQNPLDDSKKLKNEDGVFSTLIFSAEEECPRHKWKKWYICKPGSAAIGFQLNVQENQGRDYDDVATDNAKIICSTGKFRMKPYEKVSYAERGGQLGQWTEQQICRPGQAICGVQVQIQRVIVETNILEIDNTAVNNLRMQCCDIPTPENHMPKVRRELVMEMDQIHADPSNVMKYTVNLEVGTKLATENVKCFYNSVGYDLSKIQNELNSKITQEGSVPCPAKKCEFNWALAVPEIFMVPQWAQAKQTISGGERVVTYQLVADAGPFLIKTNRYIQMIYDQDNKFKTRIYDMKLESNSTTHLKFSKVDLLEKRSEEGLKCPAREGTSKKASILTSPKVTDWGEWDDWKYCPEGSFITGVLSHRRVYSEDGTDQVGMISFGLQCSSPSGLIKGEFGFVTRNVESRNWTVQSFHSCKEGFATGFQLNVLPDQGPGDDIATDNIRLHCSCGPPVAKPFNTPDQIMFPGEGRGEWSQRKMCSTKQALCGARAQSHPYQEGASADLAIYDNSGINNIDMKCCDVPSIAESCEPKEKRVLIGVCDNTLHGASGTCEFESYIGHVFVSIKDKRLMFYESLGFNLNDEVAAEAHNIIVCSKTNCEYPWETAPSSVFEIVKPLNRTLRISPYSKIELFQIVGECGFVQVRSNRYLIIETSNSTRTKSSNWDVTEETSKMSGRSLGIPPPRDCRFHGKVSIPSPFSPGDVPGTAIFTSSSPSSAPWNDCPPGYFIAGVSEGSSGVMICKHPRTSEYEYLGAPSKKIQSDHNCEDGVAAIGFQTVTSQNGSSFRLFCSHGEFVSNAVFPPPGVSTGGKRLYCPSTMALCGVAYPKLNEINWKLKCCAAENSLDTCTPSEKRVRIITCDNSASVTSKCKVTVGIGLQPGLSRDDERENCFYNSIGRELSENDIARIRMKFEVYFPSCTKCQYSWDEQRNIWRKGVVGTYEIAMHPNEKVEIYQIVGECGYMQVKTDRFVKVVSAENDGAEEELIYVSH